MTPASTDPTPADVLRGACERPWRAEGWEKTVVNNGNGWTVVAHPGSTLPEAKARAAAIVLAVNTFEQAREALRACVEHLDGMATPINEPEPSLVVEARAALAAMEGK